jgi:predicted ATPase/DNA-binding response OmpR family regulator
LPATAFSAHDAPRFIELSGNILLVQGAQRSQGLDPILEAGGFSVRVRAGDPEDGDQQSDLLVIDARDDFSDANQIANKWMESEQHPPVLVITRNDQVARWVGAGVDLLVDPFFPKDLLERVTAHIHGVSTNQVLQLDVCTVDLAGQRVHRDGEEIPLTTMEAHLLGYLASNPRRAIPREELLKKVWGYARSVSSRTTDTCVRRLRMKIEQNPSQPRHVLTVQGIGYRFEPGDPTERAQAALVPRPKPKARRTNVVPHPASFVGRQQDLTDLHSALDNPRLRLLTLLGPAGTGKTRVALRFAEQFLERDDKVGVWFVDLTDARNLTDVLVAVASVLGIPSNDCGTEELNRRICSSLDGRGQLLLILDNFEQVATAAPDSLSTWLAAAPAARFLITSRERLRLVGEAMMALPPLSGDDAVALFVERARGARPDFAPNSADHEILQEIVSRLDQLPLAIELAAARMSVLSPAGLLARMDQRFDLLQGSRRDSHGRQATMWGAISWSWNLLETSEQTALAQCSVFRAGFFLEDAERVVRPDGDISVLQLVEQLRDKSMLRTWEPTGLEGELRFGMYESIREFAWEQLDEDSRTAAQQRHAEHYLHVCEELATGVHHHGGLERLLRLAAERDNLLSIYRHAIGHDPPAAARAAMCLFELRGPLQPQLSEFDGLYDQLDKLPSATRAHLLCHRAEHQSLHGNPTQALADCESAVALASTVDDRSLQAKVAWQFGAILFWHGNLEAGIGHTEQALAWSLEDHDRLGEARARYLIGNFYKSLSRPDLARRHIRLALTAARSVGARRLEALTLHVNATIERADDPDLAESYLQTALSILLTFDDRAAEGRIRSDLGRIYLETSQLEEAEEQLNEALKLLTEAGHNAVRAHPLTFVAALHHDRGELLEARRRYVEALAITEDTGQRVGQGLLTGYLGMVAHERGRGPEAQRQYADSIELLNDTGGHELLGFFVMANAVHLKELGDPQPQQQQQPKPWI